MWTITEVICTQAIIVIMRPRWFSVEYAITFFKSYEREAVNAAVNDVKVQRSIRKDKSSGKMFGASRRRIIIPPRTRVEECTNALTGVGAAMAAGSHVEKGNWALLVIAAKIIENPVNFVKCSMSK